MTPPSHPMDSTSPPSTMEGPTEGEVPKGVFNLSCLYGIYMEGYRLLYSGLFSRGKNFVFWGKWNYSMTSSFPIKASYLVYYLCLMPDG